jgi:hypothetical protein
MPGAWTTSAPWAGSARRATTGGSASARRVDRVRMTFPSPNASTPQLLGLRGLSAAGRKGEGQIRRRRRRRRRGSGSAAAAARRFEHAAVELFAAERRDRHRRKVWPVPAVRASGGLEERRSGKYAFVERRVPGRRSRHRSEGHWLLRMRAGIGEKCCVAMERAAMVESRALRESHAGWRWGVRVGGVCGSVPRQRSWR